MVFDLGNKFILNAATKKKLMKEISRTITSLKSEVVCYINQKMGWA
jgi:hypothetical protein